MAISPERLAQLLDEHAAALELYARQWCRAPADVVQEAFVKLSRQREAPERPVAWLFRVVRNRALTARRSADRRERYESQAAAENWFEETFDLPLDGAAATAALRELPDEQREAIVAHLWGGLSFAEIAEVTGVSSSTAHRRYVEGLEQLRSQLGVTWLSKST
jgi:RNA polymerase sigma-70 factor (ECF subfamily)